MRSVVITGAGTMNPLGHTVPETFKALREGHCAIGPLEFEDVERLSIRIGAQIKRYDPEVHFRRSDLSLYDPSTQYALIAAREAVAASGLEMAGLGPRAGVILGTSGGGHRTSEDNYRAVFEAGKNRVHPFTVPRLMNNAGPAHLSMTYGLQGPSFTVSSACASSNHALGLAVQMIRSGAADVMLSGGTEAMLSFGGIKAWEGLRVMSPDGCRPFCATRNGMVQGEGSAIFVLEERASAEARGAPILAEISGFALGADAGDLLLPSEDGATQVMAAALADAGLVAKDIGYINAHGTATAANDRIEAAAIRTIFGPDAPFVSATKSLHGHLIGAAGAMELLPCLLALSGGIIAPTHGVQKPDPEAAVNLVHGSARAAPVQACLSNAFAFGGLNAALVLQLPG